ncbi:hypothetical protein PH562_08055 [Rhizobium sp. CNPSo 4062]|uniref:hypothetical protein n=1 Tax=Rhizobium sp. CNPSo 4062 TaxID=3021410 RepID=UPI00255040F8|nr:hypothetical protein [Rhizobium sp. CNPSo 4062]MDK4702195.1 hypothetical protein [Rhizobium sp. CNPSo 4062]
MMTASLSRKSRRQKASPQFEPQDVSPRLVLWVTLGLFLGMGLSVLLVFGILWWMRPNAAPPQTGFGSRQAEPGPRLEVSPSVNRDLLQRQAEQRLGEYGWIDRKAGTVHIPIDRAMAILATRGWPDRDEREEMQ